MNLLLISGFLGAGKTTFLLRAARRLVDQSLSVAVVENEVGEIGVDGEALGCLGLPVRELFGGCICCTLQSGLVETLREISETYSPDWVIVEPTGLATPSDLIGVVLEQLPSVSRIRVVVIVDVTRHAMLSQMISPLISAQIQAADVVAINKIDEADDATVGTVVDQVKTINERAPLFLVSAETGTNIDQLLDAALR